jgi:hypothetical protein
MMTTDYYLTADPEEQAELVSDVWKYANIVGKQAVAPDYKPEKDYGNDPVRTIIDKHKRDAKDNTITALNTEMLKAVEAKDATAYDTVVEALHENGVDDDTIKKKIANKYRDQYKAAYKADDLGKMIEIEEMLDMTGFRFDFKSWRKQANKTDTEDTTGQYGRGNIDLNNRSVVYNSDGSISTEQSFSFYDEDTGKEVLIPTVINGRIVSEDEAIDHYYQTGEYLGMFDTPQEADEYAEMLHNRQDWYYNR